VLTYLCAGRALLLSVPPDNLVSRIVSEVGAGVIVDPRDENALYAAAERLVEDKELRLELGEAGREYAEAKFDITHLGNRFERILGVDQTAARQEELHSEANTNRVAMAKSAR
jgi:colanic acid biosynthesis glycosyl transferase WcaI